MNQVRILLFAALRDYVGSRTLDLEVPARETVAELKDRLVRSYPGLSPARNSMMVAINREYAADDQVIPARAEIAIFPPVSGG